MSATPFVMSRYQAGLVDTCFEEGHYQPGIDILDQLRSPQTRHLTQLLAIALFPPRTVPAPPSPSKQHPRSPLSPTPEDALAAHRVLFALLPASPPAALARALPSYDPPVPDHGDDDSLIAREARAISSARHSWAILRQDFIQHSKNPTTPVDHTPAVVADHAWPVLDWIISLFEKDRDLLLSQIPPPRGASGPRWEAGAPLDIIFHAIEQEDCLRRAMAPRLLTLLINLTLSASFDATMFAAALTTRLHASSPQTVQNLMGSLPKTVPVLTFKITACQKFLSSPSITAGSKPRPRPLPKRGQQRRDSAPPSATDIDLGRAASTVALSPVLPCSDLFQLLRSDHQPPSAPPTSTTIKYVLLVSYAHLQRLLPPGERDGDWKDALSNGAFQHVVDTAFANDTTYRTALTILAGVWPPSD